MYLRITILRYLNLWKDHRITILWCHACIFIDGSIHYLYFITKRRQSQYTYLFFSTATRPEMNIIVSRPLTHVIILHSIISKDSCFLNNLPKYKIPYKSLHTVYRRMVILWFLYFYPNLHSVHYFFVLFDASCNINPRSFYGRMPQNVCQVC